MVILTLSSYYMITITVKDRVIIWLDDMYVFFLLSNQMVINCYHQARRYYLCHHLVRETQHTKCESLMILSSQIITRNVKDSDIIHSDNKTEC
jgi:hypothetical protein